MFNKLVVSTAVVLSVSAQAQSSAPERQSPYFIDQVHCEGLAEERLVAGPFGFQSMEDDLWNQMKLDFHRNRCEQIFALYGIHKFQWVTPEDLERLDLAVRVSKRFRSAKFRIEKSAMQNHIHLTGTFEAYKRHVKVTVKASAGPQIGSASESDRLDGKLRVDVDIMKSSPNTPGVLRYWVQADESSTDSVVDMTKYDVGDESNLSDSTKAGLARKNHGYRAIGTELDFFNSGYEKYAPFLRASLEMSRLTGDYGFGSTNRVELGSHIYTGVYGNSMVSPSLVVFRNAVSSAQTYEQGVDEEGKNIQKKPESSQVMYAGVATKSYGDLMSSSGRFYHSVSGPSSWFLDLNLEMMSNQSSPIWGRYGVEYVIKSARNAVVPEFRIGAPDMTQMAIGGVLKRNISGTFGAKAKVGFSTFSPEYYNFGGNVGSATATYGELGVEWQSQYVDCSIALTATSGRLY